MTEELQHTAWSLERLPKLNWASGLQRPQPQNSDAVRKPRNRCPFCLSPSPQVTSFKGQPHLLSLSLEPPDPVLAPSPGFLGRASAQQPLHIGVTLSLAILTILPPHCQAFHQSMKGTTNHWRSGTEVQSILDMGQPSQWLPSAPTMNVFQNVLPSRILKIPQEAAAIFQPR